MNGKGGFSRLTVCAEGNNSIGYGHLLRTLCIAAKLCKTNSREVCYMMGKESDELPILNAGHSVMRLAGFYEPEVTLRVNPEDGPLLIDSRKFTQKHFENLHQKGYCLVVIDDGCRMNFYPADVVIDYAPGAMKLAYRGGEGTRLCLGPEWFPLRGEFVEIAGEQHDPAKVRSLIITFGGSDPDDATARVIKVLAGIKATWDIFVLLGPGYRGEAAAVAADCSSIHIRSKVSDIAGFFGQADVAVSAAGGTCLELAALGVPMVLLELSEDQRLIAANIEKAGAALNLGWHSEVSDTELADSLTGLIEDTDRLREMSMAGIELVDGKGVGRIANEIESAWARKVR